MDDELLKQEIGAPLAGEDNELLDPIETDESDDLVDDPIDRELEEELYKTHPINKTVLSKPEIGKELSRGETDG